MGYNALGVDRSESSGRIWMSERRASPRHTPKRPLPAKVKSSVPARVLDVSCKGMQLELARALQPHDTCELKVLFDDGELTLRATVRRCRAWGYALGENDQRVLVYRAGVEFPELSEEMLERLRGQLVEKGSVVSRLPQTDEPAQTGPAGREPVAATESSVRSVRTGPIKIRIASHRIRKLI